MARLVSVNVGLPRDVTWRGETVHTAIWKEPVKDRRMVRRLNVTGDGQGDLAGHGGEHRAVMVYQMASYRYWEAQLGRNDFTFGQFGENFTVDGLSDDEVCVGDRYRIGGALFEVTQPRVTCYRVGIRMAEPAMAALLVSHHRPGFYLRVLEEGDVAAGDEIVKVSEGPGRVTVAEIDALLYLPSPSPERIEVSLHIPALSPGWKSSLQAILDHGGSEKGNPGLTDFVGPPPAWPGFRPLRVSQVQPESSNVISLSFEAQDGSALPAALPGQFLVLRLRVAPDAAPLLRNYSMSGVPGAKAYRVSVKHEVNGAASTFLHNHVKAGDVVDVSAPRGTFTLRPGDEPVVLLSAGIGATPVLAMLHSLASAASTREIWWLYEQPDRASLCQRIARTVKSTPARAQPHRVQPAGARDQLGLDYDSPGHLDVPLLNQLGVAPNAAFYLCGPPPFLRSLKAGLKEWGVASTRIHSEVFGPEEPITPGIAAASLPSPHLPAGPPGVGPTISFTRSALTVAWDARFQSLLELAEACQIPVRWSCRTGVCHTCECALIGGSVKYRPDPLEPPAEGNLLICCSQPSSEVEIDL